MKVADTISLRRGLDTRMSSLDTDRMPWFNQCRDISRYILTSRGRYFVTPNDTRRGKPKNNRLIDNTGKIAARKCSAGMMTGTANPARPWFKMSMGAKYADNSEVKLWLAEVERRIFEVFDKSNFYTSLATVFTELTGFATACMLIYEDYDDVINCTVLTAGSYYLVVDHRNVVVAVYREFAMTVDQVVNKFGYDACSYQVKNLYDQINHAGRSKEVIIRHAIEPNNERIAGARGLAGMPYRDVYWERGSPQDMILGIRGFHEKPFCSPRWEVVDNYAYGSDCPGMDALGDVISLQTEQKRKSQGIDKMMNPPMVADAQLRNEPASVLPGGVTYLANTNGVGFKPAYLVNPQLGDLKEDIKEVQNRINVAFYTDLWMLLDQMEGVQPRNEMEIQQREGEKLLQLGPVLQRVQSELLNVAIERTYAIMSRYHILPPPPPEIQGKDIEIKYISEFAQAQKAVGTTGIEQFSAFVGNLAASVPGVLDKFNTDEAIDEYGEMLGVSPKIIVPTDKAQAARDARAKQAQQQQAMQNSLAAVQGAQVLSKTDVGGGQNALQKMTGMA